VLTNLQGEKKKKKKKFEGKGNDEKIRESKASRKEWRMNNNIHIKVWEKK
jgi:hypothetical protein